MESLPQKHPVLNGALRAAVAPPCHQDNPHGNAEAANDTRMARLARTIEQEIIPRLMLAHRPAPANPAAADPGAPQLTQDDVRHFAKLMLHADEEPAFSALLGYRAKGVPIDGIYLNLLAPVARYLGDLWTDDLCSFTDVTIGLGRLQRVLRELSPGFGRAEEASPDIRSVLLLPSPSEQHTFGLMMVGEFFRWAGWSVSGGGWVAGVDAGALVAAERFDAVGFSLGAEIHLAALAEAIRQVKHRSCNPDLVVLVGGPLFAERPDHVQAIGADGMTMDGREAPRLAEGLIARRSTLHALADAKGRSSSLN